MGVTPEDFVRNLLDWDAEPPDAHYSPTLYAASIGRQLAPSDVQRAAELAVRSLPASLASDVLDGLCDSCADAFTPSRAMEWLPYGQVVDSAAAVVRFMMERLSVVPDHALDLLLQRLESERDPQVQDRLAYACWWIVNGETLLVREDKVLGCLFTPVDRRLDQILASRPLSPYARETLMECKSR